VKEKEGTTLGRLSLLNLDNKRSARQIERKRMREEEKRA